MSWLARSIANSLKFDDEDDGDGGDHDNHSTGNDNSYSAPKPGSPNQHSSSSTSPTTNTTSPRGVKEDLSVLTTTLTRQFWGVASFLAPPPQPDPQPTSDHHLHTDPDSRDGDFDENDALIAGIRSDFAEIGGRVKSGISKLSSHKTVSEITKIASTFLQFGSERDLEDADIVGVTEEVVAFARDIAMHPETWLDFPVPDNGDFEEFDMSDTQQEHALAVEQLAPRLAALRMELCPGYMSEGCFWKIYFVLLHPRLRKQDAELLSTPQIVEARAMLSHESQSKAKAGHDPVSFGLGSSILKKTTDLPREQSLSVPSRVENESVPVKTSSSQEVPPAASDISSNEDDSPSHVATELETEKHPVRSTEIQIVDKAMVEEEPVNQIQAPHSSSSSSSRFLDDKFEDDGEDWLKEDTSEMICNTGAKIPLGNDEDVSFSDLEDDDGDVLTYKKLASGSDSSTKDSRDWVQLNKSFANSAKDTNSVTIKHPGSGKVSAQNSESKESNDWLDVDDIEVM